VVAVEDLDELAAALQLFEQPRPIGPGALAAIHDSGGERELIVDMADGLGLPFAEINEATLRKLALNLEAGLTPDNPLDAWGTAESYERRFAACLTALLEDEATALGVFFSDPRDDYWYSAGVAEATRKAALVTAKPVALACNTALAGNSKLALSLRRDGVPLIIGARQALLAVRHVFDWRDQQVRRRRSDPAPPGPGERTVRKWRERLAAGALLEAEALDLLADWGIVTPSRHGAADAQAVVAAARAIGFPVALKTAGTHAHKTELGGVVLGIESEDKLIEAYRDLSNRLGPRALVQAMAPRGVEIALGALQDEEFGPVVMVAAGGILMELLNDSAVALPPFAEKEADKIIDGLKIARLLEGWRGGMPADRAALARTLAAFSRLAVDLAGSYRQIDVNPVIASAEAVIAVDALIV
ncbi:MAG TPA: acetate--CoA ligase family protein, partial [Alphaproteobacteria bacterium]|nr:acetate--CoA ligase family protein [Alphaproteobacteria bacterium]